MKNCLIIGSGRSGTSMVAGVLHQAGYFMGDKLYREGLKSNPKGFFEWKEINDINEEILANYGKSLPAIIGSTFLKKKTVKNPGQNQRWLLSIPLSVDVNSLNPGIEERIKKVIKREPFCYKDPRFSYTLPVWRRFLGQDTVFICLFREPNITVESILKECRTREYLAVLSINRKSAYKTWTNIYSHILFKNAEPPDKFFFVHYNQVYDGTALPALSDFLKVNLSGDFVDKNLKRTKSLYPVPRGAVSVYRRLCQLAGYSSIVD